MSDDNFIQSVSQLPASDLQETIFLLFGAEVMWFWGKKRFISVKIDCGIFFTETKHLQHFLSSQHEQGKRIKE